MSRLARSLAAVALTSVALVPAPASAAACSGSSGVTVVVDFASLGGGVQVRCAPASGSGVDALQAAGFAATGTQRYGLAFMCRIDGKPSASQEKCVNTPPSDAYWAYFQSANTGSWAYSQVGPSSSKVIPGGFEGWRFGGGSAPGYSPRRAGSGGGGSGSGSDAGSSSGTGGTSTDSSGTPRGPSSSEDSSLPKPKPRTAAPVEPSASETPTSSDPERGEEDVAITAEESGGSVTPWVGVGVLVTLLAGIVIIQRRRSRDAA